MARLPMTMWRTFKFLVSGVSLLFAGVVAVIVLGNESYPGMWALFGALVFCAAAPWIDYARPSRALGLAGVIITLAFLYSAVTTVMGEVVYPKQCSRLEVVCELLNLLYSVGGRIAVAAPWFLIACSVFYASCVAFKRSRAP